MTEHGHFSYLIAMVVISDKKIDKAKCDSVAMGTAWGSPIIDEMNCCKFYKHPYPYMDIGRSIVEISNMKPDELEEE